MLLILLSTSVFVTFILVVDTDLFNSVSAEILVSVSDSVFDSTDSWKSELSTKHFSSIVIVEYQSSVICPRLDCCICIALVINHALDVTIDIDSFL